MVIYGGFLAIIIILPIIAKIFFGNAPKISKRVLAISFVLLFLMFVLRDFSVGRDIPGYEQMYQGYAKATWSNYDLVWTEWGYEFLQMVFVHIFHAPFRAFFVTLYAMACCSYYLFITRYSADYTFSLLIYICFTFFTFDMSALRNMLALAICLFAFPLLRRNSVKATCVFFSLVLIAAQLHKSAYIFLLVYFVVRFKVTPRSPVLYIGIPVVAFLLKGRIFAFIAEHLKDVEDAPISIGGNLIVLILTLALSWFLSIMAEKKMRLNDTRELVSGEDAHFLSNAEKDAVISERMLYTAVLLLLFSSGTILGRMAEYFQIFLIIVLPNTINRLEPRIRAIVKMLLYTCFILYFWKFSLINNSLDIVPYRFYWEV